MRKTLLIVACISDVLVAVGCGPDLEALRSRCNATVVGAQLGDVTLKLSGPVPDGTYGAFENDRNTEGPAAELACCANKRTQPERPEITCSVDCSMPEYGPYDSYVEEYRVYDGYYMCGIFVRDNAVIARFYFVD